MWTHNPGYGVRSAKLGIWAEGARNTGWWVKSHLFHRMPSTQSVPPVSSIRLETPGVSWDGAGQASGGSAPDAGGCLGCGQGGVLKQVGALPSKPLRRESRVDKLDASPLPRAPLSLSPPPFRSGDQSLTRLELGEPGLWGGVLKVGGR